MERLSLNETVGNTQQQPQSQQQQRQPQQNALGASAPQPQPGPPQLPPQMFTTAAQLLDLTDSRLISTESAQARQADLGISFSSSREACSGSPRRKEIDWRFAKLGPIRYENQCRKGLTSKHWLTTRPHRWRKTVANLVLQDTIERIYAGKLYADVPRGIFLVRGENVLLLGEVVCGQKFETYVLLRDSILTHDLCRILTARTISLPP